MDNYCEVCKLSHSGTACRPNLMPYNIAFCLDAKAVNYYETFMEQKIKEAEKKLIEEIEKIAADCIHFECKLKCEDNHCFGNWCLALQQLKKLRGVE